MQTNSSTKTTTLHKQQQYKNNNNTKTITIQKEQQYKNNNSTTTRQSKNNKALYEKLTGEILRHGNVPGNLNTCSVDRGRNRYQWCQAYCQK